MLHTNLCFNEPFYKKVEVYMPLRESRASAGQESQIIRSCHNVNLDVQCIPIFTAVKLMK